MASDSKRKSRSNVENVELRSGYGDMHAHRDAEMVKEHVEFLRSRGAIDEAMAVEMLEPVDKKRNWPREYIEASPYYTGDEPEMVHFETAEKHRRKRDQEMLKLVEDYEAGQIDEDGNPIEQELEERLAAHLSTGDKTVALRLRSSSAPSPPPVESSEAELPKRKRKRPEQVKPLQPLPGHKDYQRYTYNQLTAVGRERGIYTPDSQSVRNALIQDDINLAMGVKRNDAGWKKTIGLYKTFKTPVPYELKRVPVDGAK